MAACIALLGLFGLAGCDEESFSQAQQLSAPVVTLEGNVAKWEADERADKFEISLNGNLSYVENTVTQKTLENGQTLKVRAVGDGTNYATSAWSNSVTYPSNSGGSSKVDYSKYSKILQTIMTSYGYIGLIRLDQSYTRGDYALNNPKFQPIPYGFLEDEGYDIDKIKSAQLKCGAELYSIDTDLYVELKVETKASTNYITNYVLKYELTKQELNEMQHLFIDLSSSKDITYYQAPFFIQEVSYQKKPEVLSEAYTTESCHNGAVAYFNKKETLTFTHLATYLGSEYVPNSLVAFHTYQIRTKNSVPQTTSRMATITLATNGYGRLEINGKSIHNSSSLDMSAILTEENKQLFENSLVAIVSYTSRDYYFKDLRFEKDLENVFKE